MSIRIDRLRKKAIEPYINYKQFHYYFYEKFSGDIKKMDYKNYGEAFRYALCHLSPSISDDELIVGKADHVFSDEEASLMDSKYNSMISTANGSAGGGQDSHMAIDYDLLLKLGINGIINKINNYISHCNNTDTLEFYNSCKNILEGVIIYSNNYADEAEKQALHTTDPVRKSELLEIARICRKVPANPAESFYEAVQSVHFITHCVSFNPYRIFQQYQLGHPDRYLYSFYKNDLDSGSITKEFAQELLDCLAIQINQRVPNGLSSGYMVGGRDTNGNIVANDLTIMCMQVIDDIKLVYPSVGLCWTKNMPDEYLDKACEILSHGRSHPAIFNDDIISEGLKLYGVPENEAHNYIHSTCVEITPVASSNVWVASPYTNMVQLLLDVIANDFDSFDDLLSELFASLDRSIEKNFNTQNEYRKTRRNNALQPLLSCFVNDCLERGLDIEKGGAKYNWIMPSFVGIANLVDALYVIKTLIFDAKELTFDELRHILSCNFEGYEALRLKILNKIPHYGSDNDDIDMYFDIITKHIAAECKKYTSIHSNANLIPSVFCWIKHEMFGRETGASPDGRFSGFPLGDGSGPCQGREFNGPTASIISSTKWSHKEFIGGVAVNMKFSKKNFTSQSFTTMKGLIKTYLDRGGFELQINITDHETLKKAVENPEQYRDLVVRIGGYSDYFVKLSSQMQQEIILRTEHEI